MTQMLELADKYFQAPIITNCDVKQWSLKDEPETSSLSITWALFRNTHSLAPPTIN